MKSTVAVAVAGLAAMVNAKAAFTNSAWNVKAGAATTITWTDTDGTGPYTLYLKTGDSSNLQTVATIASGITANSYDYTPDSSLTSGTYAFEIVDSTNEPNYSSMFSYVGSASSSSSAVSSASAMSSSMSSSMSASMASMASMATSAASSTPATTASSSTMSSSAASNRTAAASTTMRSTTSTTQSATATKGTAAATTISNTNAGQQLASPLALLLVTAAALALFS